MYEDVVISDVGLLLTIVVLSHLITRLAIVAVAVKKMGEKGHVQVLFMFGARFTAWQVRIPVRATAAVGPMFWGSWCM